MLFEKRPGGLVRCVILLRGDGVHEEGKAAAAGILPGMVVERQSTGEMDYNQPQDAKAEALKVSPVIVKEDPYQGHLITTAYANGARLFLYHPENGDRLHMLVKSGENVEIGDRFVVEGGGSGLLVEVAAGDARYAFEAVESSDGALAENKHIKFEYRQG